jgi:hypothetical protein
VQYYDTYDMDSTSYKYGRILGPFQGDGGITAAASTTLTNGFDYGFAPIKAGDLIYVRTAEATVAKRKVSSVTSATVIVVDSAVTASADPWKYMPFTIGTGADNGWHKIAHWRDVTVHILATTIAAAGGVDVTIEVRGEHNFRTNPSTIWTKNYAAADEDAVIVTERASEMRVGVKGGSGFAGTDSITIFATGRKEQR